LLSLQVNKKLLRNQISKDSGKVVLLKDLSNIKTAMASKKSRNDLDEAVKILKGEYGKCFCHTYFLCILQ